MCLLKATKVGNSIRIFQSFCKIYLLAKSFSYLCNPVGIFNGITNGLSASLADSSLNWDGVFTLIILPNWRRLRLQLAYSHCFKPALLDLFPLCLLTLKSVWPLKDAFSYLFHNLPIWQKPSSQFLLRHGRPPRKTKKGAVCCGRRAMRLRLFGATFLDPCKWEINFFNLPSFLATFWDLTRRALILNLRGLRGPRKLLNFSDGASLDLT